MAVVSGVATMEKEIEGSELIDWLSRECSKVVLAALKSCTFYFAEDDANEFDIAEVNVELHRIATSSGRCFHFRLLREAWFIDRSDGLYVFRNATTAPKNVTVAATSEKITKEESRARRDVRSSMRSVYLSAVEGYEELAEAAELFDKQITDSTPLSKAYHLLSSEQRADLRDMIENPTVSYVVYRKGKRVEPWKEAAMDVLRRLEAGAEVGPISTENPR